MASEETSATSAPAAPPWRKRLVFAIVGLVAVSIGLRVYIAGDKPEQPTGPQPAAQILPGQQPTNGPPPEAEQPPPSTVETVLPFLTEGGIAMLIGIGMGMATRAVAKLFVIFFAVVFIAIQFLAYKGILTVDWGAFATWLRDFVLNVSSDKGLGAIVQHKLPSAGSFVIGYYLGLKR